MKSNNHQVQQIKLMDKQVQEFYVDCFALDQVSHFRKMLVNCGSTGINLVVDVGGGCGFFAAELNRQTGISVRVIDADRWSVDACNALNNINIHAIEGDALNPKVNGDEDVVTFNLILHHLIGKNDHETRLLQKRTLAFWHGKSNYVFVNEYIYDSYIGCISGRLIYEITRSKFLSIFAKIVSRFLTSLRANTFGIGVRFRSHDEWLEIFDESGYEVIEKIRGANDNVSLARRFLLIKEVRKDSFLLKCKHEY